MVRSGKWAKIPSRFLETKAQPQPASVQAVRDRLLGHVLNQENLIPAEKTRLRAIFKKLDVDGDGLISAEDLQKSLHAEGLLGVSLKECKDMVWECAAGKGLSLVALSNMYVRAKLDTTGCEPRRLYHFILYKLIDKVDDGDVTADEVYAYLFPQMKNEDLTLTMKKLFGQEVFNSEILNNKENEMTISVPHFVRIMQSRLWGSSETMQLSDQRQNRPAINVPPLRKTAQSLAEERRKDRQRAVLAEQHWKQQSSSDAVEDAEMLQRVLRRKRMCLVHGITDVWDSKDKADEANFQKELRQGIGSSRPLSAPAIRNRDRQKPRTSSSQASATEDRGVRSTVRRGVVKSQTAMFDPMEYPATPATPSTSTKHSRKDMSESQSMSLSPTSRRDPFESAEAEAFSSEAGSSPRRRKQSADKPRLRASFEKPTSASDNQAPKLRPRLTSGSGSDASAVELDAKPRLRGTVTNLGVPPRSRSITNGSDSSMKERAGLRPPDINV